ncbi:MAG: phosphatase PAP2 family protein [Clostridiales bacterium]|nr:phosphatase PAP2 family protein [Clostridiales bacterium]
MNAIVSLEGEILTYIQTVIRSAPLDLFMKIITTLGDAGILWILACLVMLIFKKTRIVGIAGAISLIAEFLCVNVVLKNIIQRARPYEVIEGLNILIATPHDYSFPSGHAGSAFAVAIVMLLMLPKRWGIPALIMASLMALSRLYVGVHFPTDVIAGALIGMGTAFFSVFLVDRLKLETTNLRKKAAEVDHT